MGACDKMQPIQAGSLSFAVINRLSSVHWPVQMTNFGNDMALTGRRIALRSSVSNGPMRLHRTYKEDPTSSPEFPNGVMFGMYASTLNIVLRYRPCIGYHQSSVNHARTGFRHKAANGSHILFDLAHRCYVE